jgi:hypothetical protein
MPIYRIRPPPQSGLVDDLNLGPAATAQDILLPEDRSCFTGLLDERGNRIYRYPDPIGFRLR